MENIDVQINLLNQSIGWLETGTKTAGTIATARAVTTRAGTVTRTTRTVARTTKTTATAAIKRPVT